MKRLCLCLLPLLLFFSSCEEITNVNQFTDVTTTFKLPEGLEGVWYLPEYQYNELKDRTEYFDSFTIRITNIFYSYIQNTREKISYLPTDYKQITVDSLVIENGIQKLKFTLLSPDKLEVKYFFKESNLFTTKIFYKNFSDMPKKQYNVSDEKLTSMDDPRLSGIYVSAKFDQDEYDMKFGYDEIRFLSDKKIKNISKKGYVSDYKLKDKEVDCILYKCENGVLSIFDGYGSYSFEVYFDESGNRMYWRDRWYTKQAVVE